MTELLKVVDNVKDQEDLLNNYELIVENKV